MADVKRFVAGFTYRAPAPWETRPVAYHVEIGEYVEVDGRAPILLGEPQVYTATQAEALGFPLAVIEAQINADALKRGDAMADAAAAAKAQADAADARLSEAQAQLKAAQAELRQREIAAGAEAAPLN